jgi:hypothetical protein
MKRFIISPFLLMFLAFIIGNTQALDIASYEISDYLLRLESPREPEIVDDDIVFTAPADRRSVGIAFAHEGFSKIYWFQKLMKVRDDPHAADPKKGAEDLYRDTGILFHIQPLPRGLDELEYRLVIDGLWTVDPLNPIRRLDIRSFLYRSVVTIPGGMTKIPAIFDGPPGTLNFTCQAPPGETVTVAGDFNGWDPFMYEMLETSPGLYSMVLPLPPGTYHYAFYYRGQRVFDPSSGMKEYNSAGEAVSKVIVSSN